MQPLIDLRSDTVTRPDAEMRRAMAEAEVGDDVYGEDPTVRRLEELAAERVGHEAALFVPSGTMGNQIALRLHGRPGDEVICDPDAHVVRFEMGAMAAISGLVPRPVAARRGSLLLDEVAAAINVDVPYRSRTAALVLENTHNGAGGTVTAPKELGRLLELARGRGVPVHLDGARVMNAAVALGIQVERLTSSFDSVMFCLSKGLGAPVGSLLCGRRDWIAEARRIRKLLGGGMRQVGVLAAAGLVALERGPLHLAEDHEKAMTLAVGLSALAPFELDPATVETNIVVAGVRPGELDLDSAEPPNLAPNLPPNLALLRRLRECGVLASPWLRGQIRFVTHRDVSREQVATALERMAVVLG